MSRNYNVILIITDSLRKDHIGCYGNSWIRTPNIDQFAKESVIYTKAYPESLPTIPVRRAIYTGCRVFPFEPTRRMKKGIPWIINAGWQPLSDNDITLSEVFKSAGYRTALIGDNYHIFEPGMNFNRGFDEWIFIRGQEWDKYRSAQLISEEKLEIYLTPKLKGTSVEKLLRRYLSNVYFRRSEEDWFAPQTFREGIRWLQENRAVDKFLLVLEPFDPHEPWDPPHEFVDMYDPGYVGKEIITPKYGFADYLTEKELRHMRAHYAGEVTLLDKWFGFFMEKIYEMNLDKNTVIIFTSDHGHQLGEHNLTGKVAWGLYPELMDIPLLIRHPEGIGAGERIDEYVYNHDIFATICALCRIEYNHKIDGIDIWKYVEKECIEGGRKYITSGFANYVMYRDDQYWYISDRNGEEAQLYDLREDPQLKVNIASEKPQLAKTLFARIIEDAGGSLPKIEVIGREAYRWYEQLYL